MKVDSPPWILTAAPDQNQSGRKNQFFAYIEKVEAPAIERLDWFHVLPRNNHEQVQEEPPREQKREIKCACPNGALVVLNVRFERDRRHHGNDVEEKNHIAHEWVWSFVAQVHFNVGPHYLRDEPHHQPEAHQRPEKAALTGGGPYVQKKRYGRGEKNNVLKNVTECR